MWVVLPTPVHMNSKPHPAGDSLPVPHSLLSKPGQGSEELFTTLAQGASFKLEHIESYGVASPPDFWYDQQDPEWVLLLRGSATLQFEAGELSLVAGDALVIPAQLRHRVASVSVDAIWLAIHYH